MPIFFSSPERRNSQSMEWGIREPAQSTRSYASTIFYDSLYSSSSQSDACVLRCLLTIKVYFWMLIKSAIVFYLFL